MGIDLGPPLLVLAGGAVTAMTAFGVEHLRFKRQRHAVHDDREFDRQQRQDAFQRETTKLLADCLIELMRRYNTDVPPSEALANAATLSWRLDDLELSVMSRAWLDELTSAYKANLDASPTTRTHLDQGCLVLLERLNVRLRELHR